MNRLIVVSLLSTCIGMAGAYAFLSTANQNESIRRNGPAPAAVAFDSSAPIEQRLVALEQALSVERQARQLLEEELLVLNETIERLSRDDAPTTGLVEAESQSAAVRSRRVDDGGDRAARRSERLIDAGFTPAEAEWILKRESELRMEALQARYDARRAGEAVGYFGGRAAAADALRQELGDASYERYLEASGRPTRVAVSSVLEGSPALAAGLRPGDEIVSYAGQRVFSMDDITALTMQGAPGESIVVDIWRDGIPMQVTIPRGPLGVTGGRRFR